MKDKKDPLFFLYPLSGYLLKYLRFFRHRFFEEKSKEAIRAVNTRQRLEDAVKLHEYHRMSSMIFIFFLFLLFSSLYIIYAPQGKLLDGNRLRRPEPGAGEEIVVLWGNNGEDDPFQISIAVKERQFSKEELEQVFIEAKEYISNVFLGNNKSADEVREPLNFISKIPGTGIRVRWEADRYRYLLPDGNIRSDDVPAHGEAVTVYAILDYYGITAKYNWKINIFPPYVSPDLERNVKMKKAIENIDLESAQSPFLDLPDSQNGNTIAWSEDEDYTWVLLLSAGLVVAYIVKIAIEREQEKKLGLRNSQLLLDYPEMICKFTLLLSAGMTSRGAWERICIDYNLKLEKMPDKQKKYRYLYEEMLITKNELIFGVSESRAYENFGNRCKVLPLLRFSVIVVQNLKKGTRGMLPLLEAESKEAFTERKEEAKRQGERAGTKLLIPMAGMLLLVMIIILVPAFLSFGM